MNEIGLVTSRRNECKVATTGGINNDLRVVLMEVGYMTGLGITWLKLAF